MGRTFAISVALNAGFVVVEVVFGLISGSLALISDAGHNFGDVLVLLLAWGAFMIARTRPTGRRTYGFRRATILSSLTSSFLLIAAVGVIVAHAIARLGEQIAVSGRLVMIVAGIGFLVNSSTAWILHKGHASDDLNVRGAFLHMVADAAISLSVVVGGVVISVAGWGWVDPVLSLCISVVILKATWSLLREAGNLALDAVPGSVDHVAVRDYLASLDGVEAIHDLHIWGLSTTEVALTAHLVIPDYIADDAFLAGVSREMSSRFGISHITIQIERGSEAHECPLDRPECK